MRPSDRPRVVTELPRLSPRAPGTHKGQVGHVAVVAGSRGMSGAAILSGLGALRGGAGLVRVHTAASVQPIVAAYEPCLMTAALPEDEAGRIASDASLELSAADVLALGPGLGQSPGLPAWIARTLAGFKGPAVVDADGLNNTAELGPEVFRRGGGRWTVITPHPGEMSRLRRGAGLAELRGEDDDTRIRVAHEYAVLVPDLVVVLKGYRTVVCTRDEVYVNNTGNPGMAAGGMGDVLTGLVAALLGQELSAFDAARLGVHAHGLAADHCARQIAAVGYLAREVAGAIPAALADATRPEIGFHTGASP